MTENILFDFFQQIANLSTVEMTSWSRGAVLGMLRYLYCGDVIPTQSVAMETKQLAARWVLGMCDSIGTLYKTNVLINKTTTSFIYSSFLQLAAPSSVIQGYILTNYVPAQ